MRLAKLGLLLSATLIIGAAPPGQPDPLCLPRRPVTQKELDELGITFSVREVQEFFGLSFSRSGVTLLAGAAAGFAPDEFPLGSPFGPGSFPGLFGPGTGARRGIRGGGGTRPLRQVDEQQPNRITRE